MAFANIKGVARDPKDYEVYKPKVIIKEVPVEVEKIVEIEKIVEKIVEVPFKKKEKLLQGNLVKDLPKEEKPKKKNHQNSWGSPGGSR
jgi:hypothetical protein